MRELPWVHRAPSAGPSRRANAARTDTNDCHPADDNAEHSATATDAADEIAESYAEATATTNFQDAFDHRLPIERKAEA